MSDISFSDPAVLFVALCAASLIMIGIILKYNLLSLEGAGSSHEKRLALMSPLIGFLLFLGTCAFVPPWVQKGIHYLDTHGFSSLHRIEADSITQLVTLIIAAVLLVGFSRIHPENVREFIWGNQNGIAKGIGKGILFCLLTYPIVMAFVQGIHLGLEWMGKNPIAEQVALAQLKSLKGYPWLFWCFALFVVTLVPLVEEFLFRGLLQNYLGGILGSYGAIFITSLFFALFHYSAEQGSTNYELLAGLFLYSCCIGIFYVKERSLWTPMAMHASFNLLSILLMLYL
jgi:membrane protease YdiL (CAAX protease family)